jgi:hypothetical protein
MNTISSSIFPSVTELPLNFMQAVVELETQVECEESSNLQNIEQLNGLYVVLK